MFSLNKLRFCILSLSMHYLLLNFNIRFVRLHSKPVSLRIATYWCIWKCDMYCDKRESWNFDDDRRNGSMTAGKR